MKNKDVILFFDGVCNLCNRLVDFMMRHQKNHDLKFSSIQGQTAPKYLPEKIIQDVNTICLLENGEIHTRSEAIARIAPFLKFPWSLLSWIRLFPRPLRDFVYKVTAGKRYQMFGKRELVACQVLKRKSNCYLEVI